MAWQMEKQLLEHTLQQVLELQPGQALGGGRPPATSTSEESHPPTTPATPSAPAEAPKDGQATNAQVPCLCCPCTTANLTCSPHSARVPLDESSACEGVLAGSAVGRH